MKTLLFLFSSIIIVCYSAFADYPKLPIISTSYEFSYGTEEDEELDEIITDSSKHSIILKIKEELSRSFYFNLPLQFTFKDYFIEDDDYYYFRFSPYCSWNIGDASNIKFYIIAKWFDYDMPDSYGLSKDFYQASGKVEWSYKITKDFKVITVLKTDYGLYVNPEKMSQTYIFKFGTAFKISQYILTGKYSGTFMFPLGSESTKEFDMLNTFKVDLKWDLNKER